MTEFTNFSLLRFEAVCETLSQALLLLLGVGGGGGVGGGLHMCVRARA